MHLITIIGNIASGKSSALPIVADALKAEQLDADDLFQTKNPFAQEYLRDTPRWAFTNEMWMTFERVKLIEKTLEKLHKKDAPFLVIDSGLLMSWVYTYSHFLVGNISKNEWKLYESVYADLTKFILQNTSVIRLEYKVDTLLKRLNKRGREYELNFYTSKYLQQIEEGLQALDQKLQTELTPTLVITERKIHDFVSVKADEKALTQAVKTFIINKTTTKRI